MIYLDHNATTPGLPEVREAMLPYLTEPCGISSGSYLFGAKPGSVLETVRDPVADLPAFARPHEIRFAGKWHAIQSHGPLTRHWGLSSPVAIAFLPSFPSGHENHLRLT